VASDGASDEVSVFAFWLRGRGHGAAWWCG